MKNGRYISSTEISQIESLGGQASPAQVMAVIREIRMLLETPERLSLVTLDHLARTIEERDEAREELAMLKAQLAGESAPGGGMDLEAKLAPAQECNRKLHAALVDALEGLEDMIGYIPEYFRWKHGHQDYIDRAKAAIAHAELQGGK